MKVLRQAGRFLLGIPWIAGFAGAQFNPSYPQLPLYFEMNRGQAAESVKFFTRGPGYSLFLTSAEATLVLHPGEKARQVIQLHLKGSNSHPLIEGRAMLPGKSNYFIGNDSRKWVTQVPQYSHVAYQGVYPGIDMVYNGDGRQLEYSFYVAPGANPRLIRMDFKGADNLRINREGNLVLSFKTGPEATFEAPALYQRVGSRRVSVQGSFVLMGDHLVAFDVGVYDRRNELVIDPTLTYSTYLGGTAADRAYAIAVDAGGSAYITGATTSDPFPGTAGHFQPGNGGGTSDVFVTKMNPAGTAVLWTTYLGGAGIDQGNGIAVDSLGNVYIAGSMTVAAGTSFPTTLAAYGALGGINAFVTAINPTGTALIYSRLLGGAGVDHGNAIAVSPAGVAYITGDTTSSVPDLPVTAGAFQIANGGAIDAFVASFDAAGGVKYFTYLGGTTADHGNGIVIDGLGDAYVTGQAGTTFPFTTGAFKTTITGPYDAFITKLNPTGSGLLYSTYVGGSVIDEALAIAIDSVNDIYITGYTQSADFPTTDVLFNSKRVGQTVAGTVAPDAFIFKLHTGSGGEAIDGVYSTYLGANGDDRGMGIVVDGYGNAYVSGHTASTDFSTTTNALAGQDTSITGRAFVTEVDPTGATKIYSTYLGGSGDQAAQGIALDGANNIYVGGWTSSTDFSTAAPNGIPIQSANAGTFDAFVSKISAPTPAPPPAAPTGLVGTAVGISSISWTWNAVTGASAYNIYQATSPTTLVISTPAPNFIETGLSSNTANGRRVTAVVFEAESALSPSATAYTLAATPGPGVFTTVFYTSFTVTWAVNNPAGTRFEVSRSTTNDNFTTAVSTPIAFTDSFIFGTTTFMGLQPGTLYYLRVRAENGAVPGAGIVTAFSAAASTATLPTPSPAGLAGATLGVSSVSWNWSPVAGASAYHLYWAGQTTTLIISTPTPNFFETGLTSNTAYGRVITAVVNGIESALSPSATAYTLAATPGAGIFSTVSYTSFTLTWVTNNPTETRFEVSRSTTNDNFTTAVSTPIAFTDSFTFGTTHFTSLLPGTTYYIRVRAENGAVAGAGIPTAFGAPTHTVTLPPSTPTGLAGIAVDVATLRWTWNAVPAASSYNIYQATSPTTLVASPPTTTFLETGLSTNTAYGRVISAFINGVESSLSPAATSYTQAAAPGAGVFTNIFYSSFTITWTTNNPVSTRFEVSRSTINDNFATAVSTPVLFMDNFILGSADFSDLDPGTTYFWRIRAENGTGSGAGIATAFSATSDVVTLPTPLPPSSPPPPAPPPSPPPPSPDEFSLSPIRGPDAGGTEVTITGTDLAGATSVTFDGRNALSFTVDSNTQITARSPAQAAGPAIGVVVSRLSGNAMAGNYTYFTTSSPSSSGPDTYIFPSPANQPTASIVYTMAESGVAQIRVYNEVGDLVGKIEDTKPAGVQMSTLHTGGLAPGVYFYILNSNYNSGGSDKRKLKKFVVTH